MSSRNITCRYSHSKSTAGFTLVELLVVIAIIGILVALLLPAVQAVREAARRSQCSNNLVQISLAVNQYEMAHSVYPPGSLDTQGPIRSVAKGYHHGWISQILPYMEQRNTWMHIDRAVSVYDKKNAAVRDLAIGTLNCPSSPWSTDGYSDFAAVHHEIEAPIDSNNNGTFFLNSRVRYDGLLDGSSQTLFIGEKLPAPNDLGWMSGTNATLRNTGTPIAAGRTGAGFTGPAGPPSKQAFVDPGETPVISIPDPNSATTATKSTESATASPTASSENEASPNTDSSVTEKKSSDVPPSAALPAEPEEKKTKNAKNAKPDSKSRAPAAATPPPTSPLYVGGFGSFHPGGGNFALGDGSVRFIGSAINITVFQQLGHRADGQLLSSSSY